MRDLDPGFIDRFSFETGNYDHSDPRFTFFDATRRRHHKIFTGYSGVQASAILEMIFPKIFEIMIL